MLRDFFSYQINLIRADTVQYNENVRTVLQPIYPYCYEMMSRWCVCLCKLSTLNWPRKCLELLQCWLFHTARWNLIGWFCFYQEYFVVFFPVASWFLMIWFSPSLHRNADLPPLSCPVSGSESPCCQCHDIWESESVMECVITAISRYWVAIICMELCKSWVVICRFIW